MRIGEANYNSYSPFQRPVPPASQREATDRTNASQGRLPSADPAQDTVTITIDEKQRLKKEEQQKRLQADQQILDECQRMLESSKEQAIAAGKDAKVRLKCIIISSRIMSGDEVPLEDYKYLAKHDPELYGKALSMRFKSDNPKKYDRISEDEEEEGTAFSGSATDGSISFSLGDGGPKVSLS